VSSYDMPKADLGDIVLFYAHEGATPVPAIVSVVASRTLTLWAIAGELGGVVKPSVHHLTDPGVNDFPDWKRYGYWDHKPKDSAVSILSEKLSLLEKKVAATAPKKA
jgi:hypothetical protein